MTNLLAIPSKKTYTIDLKQPVYDYLLEHGGTHPAAVKKDIDQWQTMRQRLVDAKPHLDLVQSMLKYHAHLTTILSKLPADIQLDIAYAPVFSSSALPVTLRNLVFERAALCFNLAALYSLLAILEDRSQVDGIKRAVGHFQNAAGTLSYLRTAVLPKLVLSPDDEQKPLDLSEPFGHALEWLMLAQAQECAWQKSAKFGKDPTNSVIARLAASVSSMYRSSLNVIREASAEIRVLFLSDWLAHIEAKQYHFEAVSQYRKSRDELNDSRYGSEIAYLTQALAGAKRAYDVARKGKVSNAVQHDVQSFLEAVQKNITRAERDNDLIYHQDVPPASSLPPIIQATIVQMTIPKELANPNIIVNNNDMLFSELVSWGARAAINIYNDRKKNLIQDQLVDVAQACKDESDRTLRSLNLPASLEALERHVGLPPSLLKKAEEVRLENGPVKIEAAIEDVQKLARQNVKTLDEAIDILDREASEDESAREGTPLDRMPSHEANTDLIEMYSRYRNILDQAAASDETVRTKWDQWERNITELTWDEADLEESIPSSTASSRNNETDRHARTLRVLLEQIEELHSSRGQIVDRAKKLAEVDDVQPRIIKAASGLERLAEPQPAMFEDVLDQELAKYDKFITWLKDLETKQEELLQAVKRENEVFLQSRRDDESVKDRERALQSLNLSYQKYREILRNLEEGIKFYNDLIGILMQFKERCRQWSNMRQREIHLLSRSMHSLNIEEAQLDPEEASPAQHRSDHERSPSALPSINSNEWGFEEMSLPPPPSSARRN
ncbi:BRO1-domain-containing protein [Dendrothele bispora CBS 962.96]|uniref:BRO1-domain-containing protein n=1 Tax=Dendrothele bispora (strain CBS 962.96) TaxID=1314807 RepID=A0A4V4HHM5_DENBC|nr:BRO1-domain-containing protein [Dendrothele bispora CBS 962.96]